MEQVKYEVKINVFTEQGNLLVTVEKEMFDFEFIELPGIISNLHTLYDGNRIRADFRIISK